MVTKIAERGRECGVRLAIAGGMRTQASPVRCVIPHRRGARRVRPVPGAPDFRGRRSGGAGGASRTSTSAARCRHPAAERLVVRPLPVRVRRAAIGRGPEPVTASCPSGSVATTPAPIGWRSPAPGALLVAGPPAQRGDHRPARPWPSAPLAGGHARCSGSSPRTGRSPTSASCDLRRTSGAALRRRSGRARRSAAPGVRPGRRPRGSRPAPPARAGSVARRPGQSPGSRRPAGSARVRAIPRAVPRSRATRTAAVGRGRRTAGCWASSLPASGRVPFRPAEGTCSPRALRRRCRLRWVSEHPHTVI